MRGVDHTIEQGAMDSAAMRVVGAIRILSHAVGCFRGQHAPGLPDFCTHFRKINHIARQCEKWRAVARIAIWMAAESGKCT